MPNDYPPNTQKPSIDLWRIASQLYARVALLLVALAPSEYFSAIPPEHPFLAYGAQAGLIVFALVAPTFITTIKPPTRLGYLLGITLIVAAFAVTALHYPPFLALMGAWISPAGGYFILQNDDYTVAALALLVLLGVRIGEFNPNESGFGLFRMAFHAAIAWAWPITLPATLAFYLLKTSPSDESGDKTLSLLERIIRTKTNDTGVRDTSPTDDPSPTPQGPWPDNTQ